MKYAGILCVLLLVASAAPASTTHKLPSTDAAAAKDTDSAKDDLRVAQVYLSNNHLDDASTLVDQVLARSDFEQLPSSTRFVAEAFGGYIAYTQGHYGHAHDLLLRATSLPEANGETWGLRLGSAYAQKNYEDSATSLATLARKWPTLLAGVDEQVPFIIDAHLKDSAHAHQRTELLQALFDAGWKDSEGEPDELWQDLVASQLAQGNLRQATITATRIQSARVVLAMRVDKRFDPLTRADARRYDVDQALAAQIAAARAQMQSTPTRLAPVVHLQSLLLSSQHYEEVIALADQVIAKAADNTAASAYEDFDKKYNWLLDERARALNRLGRWDEAAQQWERAARRPEQGGMNVSQIINLGQFYADIKRPVDALSTVQELGNMSPFGRMQLEMVRLEAALIQQDDASIATHLTYMREHRADAIGTWQTALLLSNRLDEATDVLVERLAKEEWRTAALSDMQVYATFPMTPMDAQRLERWRQIIARPRVQAALAPVGRVEHFHIDPTET